jgi:hypothetical protein
MKEDHMRNAQLKPGYNLQLGVEGEYITGAMISSERSDQLTLIPFMENLQRKGIVYQPKSRIISTQNDHVGFIPSLLR